MKSLPLVFLFFAFTYFGLLNAKAQDLKPPAGWKKVTLCQINFFIPDKLKNQYAKGIDSCVGEFKTRKIRLAIDYGWHGGAYIKDSLGAGFKVELAEIDGKKARIITYKDAKNKRSFISGLYVLVNEAKDGVKTSLSMTIEVKSEKDIEIARQIFRSIRFEPFTPMVIER